MKLGIFKAIVDCKLKLFIGERYSTEILLKQGEIVFAEVESGFRADAMMVTNRFKCWFRSSTIGKRRIRRWQRKKRCRGCCRG